MVGIDGLREEVHRPLLHRDHGIFNAPVGGHDDDGDVGIDVLGGAQHAEPVAVGQAQIGQDNGGLGLLEMPDGFRLVARLDNGMALALQRQAQHRPERVFVLDEKDLRGRGHREAAQRSQPGGTPALRASSSMSAICFLPPSIACLTRASSATASLRSAVIRAFCA